MYILYPFPYSQHARRVVSLLEAAGLPYELRHVDMAKGEHLSAAYLAINPNHQVPTLLDGDLVLHESNAILRYLCHQHGLSDWYPADPKHRARVEQWLDWNQSRLSPAVIDIVPQYRGYRYFVVHDEIVLVEPDTYEIVYVIDDRGPARAGGGGGACDELALTDDERRLIIRTIEIDRFRDEHGIRVSVGERLPPRLELHEFPDAVIREVSKVRSCRFTVIDGDIAIVDPDERQVVVRVEK